MPEPILQALSAAARVILVVVVLVPLLIYLFQDRLLFFPQPLEESVRGAVAKWRRDVEELRVRTPDGIELHGWFVRNSTEPKAPALVYFGGNAEEVSGLALDAEAIPGVSLLFVNYRGYGLSEGRPGETTLFADAVLLYDWLARRPDVDPARIFVMGRSLGSGVATFDAGHDVTSLFRRINVHLSTF